MMTILKFGAPWCGPCTKQDEILEEFARFYPHISVQKVNVDEQTQIAFDFGVTTIPTLFKMNGGIPIDKHVGVMSLKQLEAWVENA